MHAQRVVGTSDETLPMFSELPVVRAPRKAGENQEAESMLASGVVQWFNPLWGHGEVLLHDGRIAVIELTSLARLFMHGIAKGAEVYGKIDERIGTKPRLCKISAVDWSKVTELELVTTKQAPTQPEVLKGVVKLYNSKKGYGFILPDKDIGGDVFVHITVLRRCGIDTDLKEGQLVTFSYEPGQRGGWSAESVQLA